MWKMQWCYISFWMLTTSLLPRLLRLLPSKHVHCAQRMTAMRNLTRVDTGRAAIYCYLFQNKQLFFSSSLFPHAEMLSIVRNAVAAGSQVHRYHLVLINILLGVHELQNYRKNVAEVKLPQISKPCVSSKCK